MKISHNETKKVLEEFNISPTQLPKISQKDAALPEGCEKGDVIKIDRANGVFYRIVI